MTTEGGEETLRCYRKETTDSSQTLPGGLMTVNELVKSNFECLQDKKIPLRRCFSGRSGCPFHQILFTMAARQTSYGGISLPFTPQKQHI